MPREIVATVCNVPRFGINFFVSSFGFGPIDDRRGFPDFSRAFRQIVLRSRDQRALDRIQSWLAEGTSATVFITADSGTTTLEQAKPLSLSESGEEFSLSLAFTSFFIKPSDDELG